MGIPETILFRDEADALKLFEIGGACEPLPGTESIAMAHRAGQLRSDGNRHHRLVRAAQAGKVRVRHLPRSHRLQACQPARVPGRRHLRSPWPGFGCSTAFDRVMGKILPKSASDNFTNFTSLLEASAFDEAGISYRLPDHMYAEESSRW